MTTPALDPFLVWDSYYKSHNEKPAQLYDTVAPLLTDKINKELSLGHAEAAIKAYLNYHGKQAEPWMYEWLIKTIEARKGPESEVKTAIGYAGALAKRNKNPNDLVRVADMMVVRNLYGPIGAPRYETNIGELVDLAAEKVPHNAIPLMMSVNLAGKTKDPQRMADAAERLLALGWPGFDDKMRADLRTQVKLLENALRDEGRADEAENLARSVADSEVRDVYVSLKWAGEADLDLVVEEPLGATAQYATPRTVFGGALIKNGFGKHPEEVYVCPRGFSGDYKIRVETIFTDEANPAKDVILTVITHEGGADEKRQETRLDLGKLQPVIVPLVGGRRKDVLPYIAPPEPPPLAAQELKLPGAEKLAPTPPPASQRNKALELLNEARGIARPK